MITIAIADKQRLTIRGAQDGRSYLVTHFPEGWWVQEAPAPRPPRRPREWEGPKTDLGDHLAALAANGLDVNPIKEKVPPCRF